MNNRIKQSNSIFHSALIIISYAAILSLFSTIIFYSTRSVMARHLGIGAQGVATATAQKIMDDLDAYKEEADTGSTDSEYYRGMQRYTKQIAENSNVQRIFTEKRIDEYTIEYVFDFTNNNNPDYVKPRTQGDNDNYREYAYLTQKPQSSPITSGSEQGPLLTAYAPILDSDRTVLGLVGVQVVVNPFFQALNSQLTIVVLICVIVFTMLTSFVIKISPHMLSIILRDELTGAYNKRYLKWFLSSWIRRSRRTGIPVSLLLVDVDHLKKINEAYGMEFGDQVLQYFSKRVMNTLRKSDCYARYGGEEFLVVLPGTFVDVAGRIGERIRRIAENNDIYNVAQQTGIRATVSIGAAGINPAASSVDQVLMEAERALKAAKERRNAVAIYTQGDTKIITESGNGKEQGRD